MTLLKFAGMLVLVLLAWTGVLIGLAFTAGPGQPMVAFAWPGRGLEVAAKAGGSYESLGGSVVVTRSGEPGFVRRLYAAGAIMVIDARVVLACRSIIARARPAG